MFVIWEEWGWGWDDNVAGEEARDGKGARSRQSRATEEGGHHGSVYPNFPLLRAEAGAFGGGGERGHHAGVVIVHWPQIKLNL